MPALHQASSHPSIIYQFMGEAGTSNWVRNGTDTDSHNQLLYTYSVIYSYL